MTFKCEESRPWHIGPLPGKYYGTSVLYQDEAGDVYEVFKIWMPDHFAKPFASEREIAQGWDPAEEDHDHVEDAQSYALACNLVEHLNATGQKLNNL
jgi:hypothetical protein